MHTEADMLFGADLQQNVANAKVTECKKSMDT